MKIYFRFFIIFLTLSYWLSQAATAEVVDIPDPNLATAVRERFGLPPNAPITAQHMKRMRGLDAGSRQIKDITGLQHAKELEVLWLGDNQISDVSPLSGLTRLKTLLLNGNSVMSVRFLDWRN